MVRAPEKRICVAAVAGAKGVRGAVRLRIFTDSPAALAAFPALQDDAGRLVRLTMVEERGPVAVIDGVMDRNAAEALRGTRLYVARSDLPPSDTDEFYHADLIGLAAALVDGSPVGRVKAVHDFGAGDILEIVGKSGAVIMLPFTRDAVPHVAPEKGGLAIDPPPGLPGLDALLAEAGLPGPPAGEGEA